jgi:hypothetical protein
LGGHASAAIAVDNDVTVGWSDTDPCVPVSRCKPLVVGAPRLIRDAKDAQSLILTITAGAANQEPFHDFTLRLRVRTGDLREVCIPLRVPCVGPLFLSYSPESGLFTEPGSAKSLADLVSQFPELLPFPLVLTLEGGFIGNIGELAKPVTLTLSGGGREVIIDRIGDDDSFHPGDALDIPARSVQMALALSRLHADLRQFPAELDGARTLRGERGRPVGFTHTFDLPDRSRIDDAVLVLHLRSVSGGFNDFVLLDEGVRTVAQGRPIFAVQRIFVRDVLPSPVVPGESYVVEVNLRRVLAALGNGQLNVIVASDTDVDFADLRVILRNR